MAFNYVYINTDFLNTNYLMDYKKLLSLTLLVHVNLCCNLAWHVAFMLNLNLMQCKHNGGLKIFHFNQNS